MTKWQEINEILSERPVALLIDALWNDPAVVAKIRARLDDVPVENMKYYHAHFVGDKHV